jgi:ABC-type nitrate/sulfonate/bicarbonate transport system substrate-binding protein
MVASDFTVVREGRVLDATKSSCAPADLLIRDGRIECLGPPGMPAPAHAATVWADDQLIIPGLVNAHTHGHGSLSKGVGERRRSTVPGHVDLTRGRRSKEMNVTRKLNNMAKDIRSLIRACVVAVAAASLPFASAAQDKAKVVVAVAPSADMANLIIAVKGGFLEKEGLIAELKVFDSSPKAVQALVSGQADITNNTEPPHLAARARGADVVWVMTGYRLGSTNGSIANGKVIKKSADFVGKTIGVQRGSGAHFHLAWFLDRNGIKADQVEIRFMAAPDQIAALARGDIDAFFSWEPFLTRATDTVPGARLHSRLVEDGLEFNGNVLMRGALAREDAETAGKIVRGLIATADWMNANLPEAAKLANEVLRAPSEEQVLDQISNIGWPGNFKRSVAEQATMIADWGIGIELFPAESGRTLVDGMIHPDIIKAVAPDRTDF